MVSTNLPVNKYALQFSVEWEAMKAGRPSFEIKIEKPVPFALAKCRLPSFEGLPNLTVDDTEVLIFSYQTKKTASDYSTVKSPSPNFFRVLLNL